MGWLVAIVVLILIVVSRGFRRFALVLVALGAAVGGFYYIQNEHEEKLSLTRIYPSELILENVTLKLSYGTYRIVGRITNRSKEYSLKRLDLVVTMRDCKAGVAPPSCVVIGESKESMYLDVPAGQARDFDEPVYFSGNTIKAQGELAWDYRIETIKGEKLT